MKGLTDIHCHMLPNVDDGASSIKEALVMLKIARNDGIRRIILTPHYHIGRNRTDINIIRNTYLKFRDIAGKRYPDIQLYLGQEIYYFSDAVEKLRNNEVNTLAGSAYVLLEFYMAVTKEELSDAVYETVLNGYIPVLAHAERYACLIEKPDIVENLIRQGAYIQVNADTILGSFLRKDSRFVWHLLKRRMVHFVSSDAHSAKDRTPRLKDAYMFVRKKYGSVYAKKIFYENQEKILNNELINN